MPDRENARPTGRFVALVTVVVAAVGLRHRMVEVAGSSMEPTLLAGDRLLTVPAARRLLRAGRIVVLEEPGAAGHLVVKRLVRVSGDRVEVRGDDPTRSTDSRTWGQVPVVSVRSVAVCRWPDVRRRLL